MQYSKSPTRDIWSSNSSKFFHSMKTRSVSVTDYSGSEDVTVMPSARTTAINGALSGGSHHSRSRLHSFPIGEGIRSGSKMNLDVVEDTFSSAPKSGLVSNCYHSKVCYYKIISS